MRLLILCLIFVPHVVCAFCFEDAGNLFGISPALLQTIAKVESNMNPRAVHENLNGTRDVGLMQINSSWFKRLRLSEDDLLSDVCGNVKTGARILNTCIERYGYSWEAVGCYNATSSPKKIGYAWKIYRALKEEDRVQQAPLKEPENTSSFTFTSYDKFDVERQAK